MNPQSLNPPPPVFDEKVRERGDEAMVELPERDDGLAVAEQHGLVLVEYVLQTLRDGAAPAEGAVELRLRLLAHLLHDERQLRLRDGRHVRQGRAGGDQDVRRHHAAHRLDDGAVDEERRVAAEVRHYLAELRRALEVQHL